MEKINIGVTGTGSLIGQAVIKSITRSNLANQVGIIGFDYFNETVGSFWSDVNYLLPDILKKDVSHEDWLSLIIKKIKLHNIKILFVGVDFELPLFSKYKQVIEKETGAVVMVSAEDVISIADDKYLTYQFLEKHSLSRPLTYLPHEINFDELSYPVIIKPRKGARSVGVYKIKDKQQLEKFLSTIDEPIIQECVGTEAEEYTCGTIFLNGELKKVIVLNRSLKEGNTFISRYKKDFPKSITTYLEEVCKHLKPYGACNFQLRLDQNGIPKIFEINSRHSGTTFIRSLFGYREIEYIINVLLFDTEIEFDLQEGTAVRYFDEFFVPNK